MIIFRTWVTLNIRLHDSVLKETSCVVLTFENMQQMFCHNFINAMNLTTIPSLYKVVTETKEIKKWVWFSKPQEHAGQINIGITIDSA